MTLTAYAMSSWGDITEYISVAAVQSFVLCWLALCCRSWTRVDRRNFSRGSSLFWVYKSQCPISVQKLNFPPNNSTHQNIETKFLHNLSSITVTGSKELWSFPAAETKARCSGDLTVRDFGGRGGGGLCGEQQLPDCRIIVIKME